MAAKSVFKMAEGYFPLGGRVEITSFVVLIINFAPKVLCSKRILPKMLVGERCLKTAAFRWYQTCLVWCFFLSTKQAFTRQGIVKTSLPLVFAFCLAF